ncbi:hypothetical protein LG307_06195 [Sutcliffiella horikoshii]|uniref:hypothetical protein n=1 Tax=Sutcliffiella horikoshii TaxID=79883 RepID=UPI00384E83A5
MTRKKEERGPHHRYEDLGKNEISLKWSKMKCKGNPTNANISELCEKRDKYQ